jgi:hypothetical protein
MKKKGVSIFALWDKATNTKKPPHPHQMLILLRLRVMEQYAVRQNDGEAPQLVPMRNDDLFMFRTCTLVIIMDLLWPL